jgi:hypothetical protein
VTTTLERAPFTVRGHGFTAGPVNLAVDLVTGTSIGQAMAGNNGVFPATTFTMPLGVVGSHLLVAWQVPEARQFRQQHHFLANRFRSSCTRDPKSLASKTLGLKRGSSSIRGELALGNCSSERGVNA